ncbi:MAG: TonB-dependent receptor, partial [Myxococcota bacterium]
RPPFGSGQLILRGSAPADSQVFLDGVPVPLLYHFGGLTSFLPSPLVDRIDFFPSNFSVRYGRRIGGVVEVRARPPRTDGFHFAADLNAVDTSLLLETPLGTWGSVAAGFRQSLIGYWLTPLLDGAGTSNISAPVYQDYQVIGSFRLSSSDELILRSYGSRDGFAFTSTEPEDENPFEVGRSSLTSDFDRVDLTWKRQYSQGSAHEITVAGGSRRERFQLGEAQRTVTEVFDLVLRAEFQHAISDRFNLRLGADTIVAPYEIELFGPPPGASEGAFESPEFDTIDVTTDGLMMRPAAYAELDIYPVEELQLILGLRADYFGTLEQLTFDPRVAAIYSVTDRFRLKAGVGMFSQAPELVESDELLGNPDLGAIRAVHSAIGFEADVGEYLRLGTEGFFKHLYNRVVQSTESGEGFVNNGIGRIYGFEVSAMLNATEGDPNDPRSRQGPIGFLNYTLSRSERSDQGGPWRLFDFDQTHLLTASAGYQLRGGWRFSALFRLASGNPITPAERGIYDVAADQYRPVYGTLNSDRAGFFHRLDVRIEKQWLVEPVSLTFYVDIQNVYNRQNPESRNYNYNFTESSTSNGLPIIPSIGLRGEM